MSIRVSPMTQRYPLVPTRLPERQLKRPNPEGDTEGQGEVCVEMRNPVTGKRRFIYGRTEEELDEIE